jgi:hypothetical protein
LPPNPLPPISATGSAATLKRYTTYRLRGVRRWTPRRPGLHPYAQTFEENLQRISQASSGLYHLLCMGTWRSQAAASRHEERCWRRCRRDRYQAKAEASAEPVRPFVRVGSENGHLTSHSHVIRRQVVAHGCSGVPFGECAAALPRRLYATATAQSATLNTGVARSQSILFPTCPAETASPWDRDGQFPPPVSRTGGCASAGAVGNAAVRWT